MDEQPFKLGTVEDHIPKGRLSRIIRYSARSSEVNMEEMKNFARSTLHVDGDGVPAMVAGDFFLRKFLENEDSALGQAEVKHDTPGRRVCKGIYEFTWLENGESVRVKDLRSRYVVAELPLVVNFSGNQYPNLFVCDVVAGTNLRRRDPKKKLNTAQVLFNRRRRVSLLRVVSLTNFQRLASPAYYKKNGGDDRYASHLDAFMSDPRRYYFVLSADTPTLHRLGEEALGLNHRPIISYKRRKDSVKK